MNIKKNTRELCEQILTLIVDIVDKSNHSINYWFSYLSYTVIATITFTQVIAAITFVVPAYSGQHSFTNSGDIRSVRWLQKSHP